MNSSAYLRNLQQGSLCVLHLEQLHLVVATCRRPHQRLLRAIENAVISRRALAKHEDARVLKVVRVRIVVATAVSIRINSKGSFKESTRTAAS